MISKLTKAEWQRLHACKVCQNQPDDDGSIEHGRGCYVVDANGGGTTWVDVPEAFAEKANEA